MTLINIFDRLVEIAAASNGGARGDSILSCDMVHQDALYRMQEDMSRLIADVANACGPKQVRGLESKFPRLFTRA